MKQEKQVCTVEQAKKLKQLGIVQGYPFAGWYWYTGDTGNNVHSLNILGSMTTLDDMCYTAFTVAELGMMLPDEYIKHFSFPGWITPKSKEYTQNFSTWFYEAAKDKRIFGCRYDYDGNINIATDNFFGTEAHARGGLLIHLLEQGLITAAKVNEQLEKSYQ